MIYNRRQFLKGAAAAAAALAGPTILPASALGRSAQRPPSERIQMGLIGCGPQGISDMRNYLSGQSQVLAVCDVDKSQRDKAAAVVNEAYQGTSCATYNDFRELLARGDMDAVIVGTPDHWHAVASISAAKAGCDIYCEKPLTQTIAEGRAMVNVMRRYNRVLQTGSQQRSQFEGRFRRAAELVRNGYLGQLKEVFVHVNGPPAICTLEAQDVPSGLDWDLWLGPAQWRPFNSGIHPFNWRGFREFGGGGMTDWGAHHFDIVQWALDMDGSGPVEVHPPDARQGLPLTYVYANGVKMYHVGPPTGTGKLKPPREGNNSIVFLGDKGWAFVTRRTLETSPARLASIVLSPNDTHLYQSPGHHTEFLDCIRTRRRPNCDVEVGHRTATVCHLGNLAYRLGRPLKWNPATEEIVGDPQASRLLDTPKRSPWSTT